MDLIVEYRKLGCPVTNCHNWIYDIVEWLREEHAYNIYIVKTNLNDFAPFISTDFGKEIYNPFKNNNLGINYEYKDSLNFILNKSLELLKNDQG